MPTVPTSFAPQVDVSTQGAPAIQAPEITPMRNAAPEQMQEMGRATLQAGVTVMKIGQRIQDEIDESETKAADVEALRQAQEILRGENGYLKTSGRDAEANYQAAQEQLAKVFQDTSQRLGNDVQRRMFDQVAARNLLTLQGQMADHKFREVKVYSLKEGQSRMNEYTAEAVRNYESRGQVDENGAATGAFNTAINTALAEADNLSRLNGWDVNGSQAKELRNAVYSTVTTGVVSRLLDDDNPAAARTFYDEQLKAGRLDEQTATRLNSAIDNTEDRVEVINAVDRYTSGDLGTTPDGRTSAKLIMPVDTTVVSKGGGVGAPRDGGKREHNGIDLAVPVGTKVRAPYGGEVIQVWEDTKYGGGMSMRVRLDNGDVVGFAHLSGYDAKVGDRVSQGQVVARSGDTGTGGPHLHYTLKRDGKAIDPRTAGDVESGGGAGSPLNTSTSSLETALAAVDRDYAGKPLMRDQIKAGIRQNWSQMKAIENQKEEDNKEQAIDIWYKNGGNWRAIPSTIWAGLSGDVKMRLQEGIPRHDNEEKVLELLRDPSQITPGNIEKYRPYLSEGTYRSFYAKAYAATETTVRAVSIDNDQLNSIFNANGLGRLVSPKAGTEDATASIQMQTQIRDIIDTEQSQTGKELTRDRKRQIMEQVIMNRAFVSQWGTDKKKPVALLSQEEMADAYVMVGTSEVKLTQISAEQRRLITDTLTRRGRPVTEQAIAELWVKAGRPR